MKTLVTLAAALAFALITCAWARADALDDVWLRPPPEGRTWAYWWWLNSHVDAAAITSDLEGMKAKGFGGAVIFDAGGAEQRGNGRVPAGPTYGSSAWRGLLRHTLAEGERLGLQLSLNLQSGWNLGGPSVKQDDAVKGLTWAETEVTGGVEIVQALPLPERVDGYYREVAVLAYPVIRDHSGGVRDWRQKALQAKLAFSEPDAWFKANSAPRTGSLVAPESGSTADADLPLGAALDLTAKVDAQGRLHWAAPPGRWSILRFGCTLAESRLVSTSSDGWQGYALDVFDAGAFNRYAQRVVEPILEEMRPYLGRSLRYLHTDSWEVDLANWTPKLLDAFQRHRGYDPRPYLPALAGRIVGSRLMTDRFYNDYRRTLGDLAIEGHFQPFHDLARRYHLGMHPESGGPHYTAIDAQECLGMDDIPMSEFWARSATHRTTEATRFFVKQPASAAHTYGHPVVMAEGFTSVGPHWQETLWDNLKPSFDHALAEGLNRVVWHAFVCSPASEGLPGQQYFAGTHFNPQVTWWGEAGPFIAYLDRCQAMMQRGQPVADALYYYGDRVPNFTQSRVSDPTRLGLGFDYDVIDARALCERVTFRNRRLELPDGLNYRVLVLDPQREISLPVLRRVAALARAGATISGLRPDLSSSLSGQPAADAEVRALAQEVWGTAEQLPLPPLVPDVAVVRPAEPASFDWVHRRDGTTEIYFVANRRAVAAGATLLFRVQGRTAEFWDPVTGGRTAAEAAPAGDGQTAVTLELPAYGSVFVVFHVAAPGRPVAPAPLRFQTLAELSGSWSVSFDPRWGGPEHVEFPSLSDWTKRPEPGIRHYAGHAVYRRTLHLPNPPREWWLDLGLAREIASVRLNGRECGIVWAPPFRVNLSPAAHAGDNELEVTVTNFWPNRIIGDAGLPPSERFTRTNIRQLTATTALMPSGLLGPVRLLWAE